MVETKKNLKILSIAILVLAGLSLVFSITNIFLATSAVQEATPTASKEAVLIAQIVVCVISILVVLPQVYVGIKGLKMVKNPDSSKAHIVWATILFVLALLALISPITSLIKAEGSIVTNLLSLVDTGLDAIIFALFIKYAKALRVK